MDTARLLECLDTDVARLREVAARDLSAPVPTCPEWTVEELVRHRVVVDGDRAGNLIASLRRLLTAVTNTA